MRIRELPFSFWLSLVLAVASLGTAWVLRTLLPSCINPWGYVLLGGWALVPPLWFLYEFASEHSSTSYDANKADRLKQLHELSRNVWIALVVVLAAILGVKWPVEPVEVPITPPVQSESQ